jgi:hypothetical protein
MIDKKHIGYAPPPILWDVEKGRIAFFAKVIGLADPIHTDEAAAKAAGYTAWHAGTVKKDGDRKAVVIPSLGLEYDGSTLQVR